MIGQRIKQARLAAGLSLDQTVSVLAKAGTSLTKAALSKYEREVSTPKASLLQVLGKAFNVAPDFFLREHEAKIAWFAYRRRSRLGVKEQQRIQAVAEERVDDFLRLRSALNMEPPKSFADGIPVMTAEQAENAAMQLRTIWGLGDIPIESLIETLEDCDCIIVDLPDQKDTFDGLAGIANQTYPVVVSRQDVSADRKRFTIAHELGHLVMDTGDVQTAREEERLADRFAASFLVPSKVAYRELGRKRSRLSFEELALLKQKHGLSIQAWLYRARDLGIIEEGHFNTLFVNLSAAGMRKCEPGEYKGQERPAKFALMVRRALSEGLIDREQAIRWCPEIQSGLGVGSSIVKQGKDLEPKVVYALPKKQREMILREAASNLADVYQAGSDALVEDIMDHWEGTTHAGNR